MILVYLLSNLQIFLVYSPGRGWWNCGGHDADGHEILEGGKIGRGRRPIFKSNIQHDIFENCMHLLNITILWYTSNPHKQTFLKIS